MVPTQPSRSQRLTPARLAGRAADQLDRAGDSDVFAPEGDGRASAGTGEAVRAATRGQSAAVEETLQLLAADDPRHAVVAAEQLAALRCLLTSTRNEEMPCPLKH